MPETTPSSETVPFSAQIRTATERQHADAENSTFIGDMLGGDLGIDAFYRYTGQLWHVYRALEVSGQPLVDDPVAGPFVRPELARLARLEADLAHLGGDTWRNDLDPLPATVEYAGRITECAQSWPAGYVAHHYTRYLGDLSGGQAIRGKAEKLWQLPKRGAGVLFYVFDQIPNPAAFKREYRTLLDRLAVDDIEKQRVLGECRRAFTFNTALFGELAAEFPVRRQG